MNRQECIHTIKQTNLDRTTFIILSGGKSGVKGTQNIPLTKVNNRTLVVDHQIKTINKYYKNADILLMTGFESKRIIQHIDEKKYPNVRIFENKNYSEESIIDAWKLAVNCCCEGKIYLIHGDRIFNQEAIIPYSENHICVSVYKNVKKNYDLGITHINDKLINISYGLPEIWSEILFVPKKYYRTIKAKLNQAKTKKIYTVEKFLNTVNQEIDIYVDSKNKIDIKSLKEMV
tara:strand:+ start:7483 stop:8178 length:696 start_codon:yes stop_codon:yes gene_type:complete